jgi:hypothetical protein
VIRYLNDASNNIQYTDRNGMVITRNPFDAEFVSVSQRLSLIHSNDATNQQIRKNYEDAVRDAQINIDAGRPAPALPPVPSCIITPEDFALEVSQSTEWTPPLLTLKPAPASYPATGLRGPLPTADPHPLSHIPTEAAATIVTLLASVGPALPNLIDLLRTLLHHSAAPAK